MKTKCATVLGLLTMVLFAPAEGSGSCDKRDALFRIERSKNRNMVQYDACLQQNNDISDANPVEAYWVLEDGRKKELNVIESKQAFGVEDKEKLGENRFRISLAAAKDRMLTVQKVQGDYKALAQINGESSILERVYVKSENRVFGLPKIRYVDLFGRSLRTNQPVKERVNPG